MARLAIRADKSGRGNPGKRRLDDHNSQNYLAEPPPTVDLSAAGLPKNSVIRWRLATIPNDPILNRIGVLGVEDSLACERELARMFA